MVNIAVLGAGFMGRTHARALATLTNVNLIGVSSRQPEKAAALAQEVGATPFSDADALLADVRVDAVSFTLPTHLHRRYTLAALRAGKHVLLEKPMGLSLRECDAMIAAAHKAGRILMVGHVARFWPEYVALAQLVQSGELGRPLTATAQRLSSPATWGDWFQRPEWTGGAVLDLHIHDLDLLNWLFGAPQTVFARGQRGATGGWDAALTTISYAGATCFAEANALMPEGYPFSMALRVQCEQGVVDYAMTAGGEQVDSIGGGRTRLTVYTVGEAPRALAHAGGDGYAHQCAEFVRCVESGQPPTHGAPEQGRLAVKTALAVRRSLERGRAVKV